MKISTVRDNVKGSSGLEQTTGFTIQANAHAFDMLSSGLYSDRVTAILREIGCNAYDAHVEAGIADRPFHVKLPNSLDDQFFVQDWGPGITHDDVMRLYTSYFCSTKQDRDDMTGAFGLGSKSPFSYTDSFSVVSVSGGKKRTYAMYLDNSGAPTVSLMSEEDPEDSWPSGIRVGFAVKPADYAEFQNKARSVFKWFATLPTVKGVSTKLEASQLALSCDDFDIVKTDEHFAAFALMGNVRYPIDTSPLNIHPSYSEPDRLVNYLSDLHNTVLKLPIGSVDVVGSREHLKYSPRTIRYLKQHIKRVVAKLGHRMIDEARDMASMRWDNLCKAKSESRDTRGLRTACHRLAIALGVDAEEAKTLHAMVNGYDSFTVPEDVGIGRASVLYVEKTDFRRMTTFKTHSIRGGKSSFGNSIQPSYDKDTVIYFGPGVKHLRARLMHAVKDRGLEQFFVVTSTKTYDASAQQVSDEAGEVSKALWYMPLKPIGELELPPNFEPPKHRPRSKAKLATWTPTVPAIRVPTRSITGKGDVTLTDVGPANQVYIVHKVSSAWGRSSVKYRQMKRSTVNEDMLWEERQFDSAWASYATLAKQLDLEGVLPTEAVVVSTSDLKKYRLAECGWKFAPERILELMRGKAVRDAIEGLAKDSFPAAPQSEYELGSLGWMSAFAHTRYVGRLKDETAEMLKDRGLLKTIDRMAKMTKDARKTSATGKPEILENYEHVCQKFGEAIKAPVASGVKPITAGDIDGQFLARFPRSGMMSASWLNGMLKNTSTDEANTFLKYIFDEDKEKP